LKGGTIAPSITAGTARDIGTSADAPVWTTTEPSLDDWAIVELWLAVSFALAFALTNGFHDAANAIATLVASRGAAPGPAIALSAVFNLLGAILVGTAVANTIAGIVTLGGDEAVAAIGAGALAATTWNLVTWWRGLPSSSGHALVGGLAGAALASGGADAVRWGGLDGWKPVGVLGVLIALAVSPVLGLACGVAAIRLTRTALRRATRRVRRPIDWAQWGMSAALSFSHGANDAQKAMGVVGALLVAAGRLDTFSVPPWAMLACGAALTVGTALGGWRIVRTLGRRIFRLGPLDAFSSQAASTAVILSSSFAGAPVSTTHVVASSVIGVGGGRRRWAHVRWAVVRSMAFAWLLTLPVSAVLAAATFEAWTSIA
jgi:PiT family inorganic phosphate transporter